MFVKSSKAAKEAGISSKSMNRKRFDFFNKKRNKFYIRVIPNDLEGYTALPIAYHRHLAKINLTNKHTGQDTSFEVNAACVAGKGVKCPGCEASEKQKDNPAEKGRSDFYKIDKSQIVGHFFLAYEVFLNEDGSFYYSNDPKEAAPKILEYGYKKGVCLDFDNFVDAYESALARGIDPCDAENGVVIRVERQEMPTGYGNSKKIVHVHTATDKKLALPSQWKTQVQAYDRLDERYMKFSAEDLRTIVETDEAIKVVMSDSSIKPEEKLMMIESLTEEFKKVSHPDFVNIIDFLENKEPSEDRPSGGYQAQESRPSGAFSKTGSQQPSSSTPPWESSEPASKPTSQPQTDNGGGGSQGGDFKGALDRINALKAKRNQNN